MVAMPVMKRHLLRVNSKLLGRASLALGKALDRSPSGLSGFARLLVDAFQPVDPLGREENLPSMDVIIPFVLKDLEMLGYAVSSVVQSSRNPIGRVALVTPKRTFVQEPKIEQLVTELVSSHASLGDIPLELLVDEEILPHSVLSWLEQHKLPARDRGWVAQQLVKISCALASTFQASLVVDADTVLMHKRTWVTADGRQILMIGQESRDAFFSFTNKFLGFQERARLSFVTHHQLMQKDILIRIFGSADGLVELMECAVQEACSPQGLRSISEYEIYGAFLSETMSQRGIFASWGNGSGFRDSLQSHSSGDALWALSVSYHHYLSRSGTPDELL